MRPAIFLDRDDTLIENRDLPWAEIGAPPGDLCNPEYVRLLPGVREACEHMANAGYSLVAVTNQGLVARGVGSIDDVERTNARLHELLTVGAQRLLERIYYCPFHPQGTVAPFNRDHPWRKPAPGMILAAADELGLDLSRSWLVGDAKRDVEAGRAAGISAKRCLLVGGNSALPDLGAASRVILGT